MQCVVRVCFNVSTMVHSSDSVSECVCVCVSACGLVLVMEQRQPTPRLLPPRATSVP